MKDLVIEKWFDWDLTKATSSNVTVGLTGQTATFTAGTITPATAVGLSGLTATFTAGTLTPATSLALSGLTATFTAGTLVPTDTVPLSGLTATFTAGTITASTGGNVTVALTGQTATFTAGALTPAIDTPLSGLTATFTAGTLTPANAVGLTGLTATFTAGSLTPATAVPLSGLTATFSAGTITASTGGDVTVALSGLVATFSAGQLTASGADVVTPTVVETPAGRRRIRDIYRVTVDGTKFEFKTLAEAIAFLTTAKDAARILAMDAARKATERQTQTAKRIAPPRLKSPVIGISSRELRKVAGETKREIEVIYQAAARDAEIAMLLELSKRMDDDEDSLFLLM